MADFKGISFQHISNWEKNNVIKSSGFGISFLISYLIKIPQTAKF